MRSPLRTGGDFMVQKPNGGSRFRLDRRYLALLLKLQSAKPESTASASALGLGLKRHDARPKAAQRPKKLLARHRGSPDLAGWLNFQTESTKERNEELRMMHAIARDLKAARLLAFLVATIFAAGPAHGQAPFKIGVPYSFTVSSTQLPAGTYTFSIGESRLVVRSSTGEQMSPSIITRLSGPNPFLQAGSLVFDSTDGRNILSEVWLPGGDGVLVYSIPRGHTRAVLSFSELATKGHASGKTAYELTCARCHGVEGKGNVKADQYFGITIPRLSSAEVQGKSDAELRAIITAGTKNMPPVEVEEAGFRHRLPPQDVDSVIAYLRTLKQ